MKTTLFTLGIAATSLVAFAADPATPTPTPAPKAAPSAGAAAFKTEKEKVSYIMGRNIGSAWKRQDVEFDIDLVVRGVKEALDGTTPSLFTDTEAREIMMAFQKELRTKQEEKRKATSDKNKQEGDAFLAANKSKTGVITLPSGLQYQVLNEGTGTKPRSNDIVSVNYRGTLIDGTEFDSSTRQGKPATFAVNGVIKGWTEALQLMAVGSKWKLFIPPSLAYGEFGNGRTIGGNSTLVFEIELISAQPPPPPSTNRMPAQPITSDIIKVPSAEEMKKGAKIEVIKPEDVEKEKASAKTKPDAAPKQ